MLVFCEWTPRDIRRRATYAAAEVVETCEQMLRDVGVRTPYPEAREGWLR